MSSTQKICPQCKKLRVVPDNRKICQGCRRLNAHVSKGRVRPPDYPHTTIIGYKEPLEPVKGGFSYYGAITRTKDGEHIQCHICGYFFASLGAHIQLRHEVDLKDYKMKYGLRIKHGLVSPIKKLQMQEHYNKTIRDKAVENAGKAHEVTAKLRAEGKLKPGGNTWSAQGRNERGICREQTIAKIQSIAAKNDGYFMREEFLQEFGYGQADVVKHWFTTFDNACKEAGVKSYKDKRQEDAAIDTEQVIENVIKFYKETGRTPMTADFNSLDQFPSHKKLGRVFGNLNNLRQIAGVPLMVKQGKAWVQEKTNG